MSIDTQKFTAGDIISIPFGMRLKSAREARGLESKDVAAQLRLSEKMIAMIEKETYPIDLPVTFVRGYIRAYARLMEIPDSDINKALEPIKPLPMVLEEEQAPMEADPVTSSNYFMQFFTYLIFFTIVGLVGVWWYSHSAADIHLSTEIPIIEQHNTPSDNAMEQNTNASPLPAAIPAADALPGAAPLMNNEANPNQSNPPVPMQPSSQEMTKAGWVDSSDGKPESFLVIRMIHGEYPIQFLTHLILFLLIGFVILGSERHALNVSAAADALNANTAPFDPALNLEMVRSEMAPFMLNTTSRNKREIKRTMRILSTLVLLSLISLTGMWWYHNHPIFTGSLRTDEILQAVNTPTPPAISNPVLLKTETKAKANIGLSTDSSKTDLSKTGPQIENVKPIAIENAAEVGKNTPVLPQEKENESMQSSSEKYTPVPTTNTNKVSSKHHRRQAVVSKPIADDFSDLD